MPSYPILTIPWLMVYFFHIIEISAILTRAKSILAGRKLVPNSNKSCFNMTASLCSRHIFIQIQYPQPLVSVTIGLPVPLSSLISRTSTSSTDNYIFEFKHTIPLSFSSSKGLVGSLGDPGLFFWRTLRNSDADVVLSSLFGICSPHTRVLSTVKLSITWVLVFRITDWPVSIWQFYLFTHLL